MMQKHLHYVRSLFVRILKDIVSSHS
jgi:hypothetical protein